MELLFVPSEESQTGNYEQNMRDDIRQEVTTRRTDKDLSGSVENAPVIEADSELERQDDADKKDDVFFLRQKFFSSCHSESACLDESSKRVEESRDPSFVVPSVVEESCSGNKVKNNAQESDKLNNPDDIENLWRYLGIQPTEISPIRIMGDGESIFTDGFAYIFAERNER